MKIKKITTKTVGEVPQKYVEETFNQLLAFQGYGFNYSHALCYSYYAAMQLYLKKHYPLEFMCGTLDEVDRSKEFKGVHLLDQRVRYCFNNCMKVVPPNVNTGDAHWSINSRNELVAALNNIKGFGQKDFDLISSHRPYTSCQDFLDKTHYTKGKFETLLFAGALDDFGDRITLWNWYENVYSKKSKSKKKKEEDQMLLFGIEGAGEEQEEEIPITKKFTKKELREKFYECNGFTIQENVLKDYMHFFKSNPKIKTIAEIKKKRLKYPLMMARVESTTSFVSKTGKEWTKILFSDGSDDIEMMLATVKYNSLSKTLADGNIVIIPVSVSESDILFMGNDDKFEIRVLERG